MKPTPMILPFPVPPEPRVIGLLDLDGREVLVKVTFGPEPTLTIYDPASAVRLRRDLTPELRALSAGIAKAKGRLRVRGGGA